MAMSSDLEGVFGPVSVTLDERDDGSRIFRSTEPLGAYPPTICQFLEEWARKAPERTFLAARDGEGGWREISYAEFRTQTRAIAGAFLNRGLNAASPVLLLSDNAIENALIQFGAMYAGVPAVPVSPAYSLMSTDLGKLHFIAGLVRPALVFADDGGPYGNALSQVDWGSAEIVCVRNGPDGATAFDDLSDASNDAAVDEAFSGTGPDTVAKILFTSGSTGEPKGVINTHRMMCSNQQAIAQMWPFIEARPPVLLDWLPWHHTFGGNHNVNMILRNGGTLYIDNGKPAPGLIERTIANLREVSPTLYFNVPRGYDMILPALEGDADLRDRFFANLDIVFYAAAALPQNLWKRLESLRHAAGSKRAFLTTAWGSTETSPLSTSAHFPLERAGNIGVPAPGTEIKLVPAGAKLELRVKGPNVTPGYFRRDDLTEAAFDEEGFYLIGDAGRFLDERDPAKGIAFDGRVAEDFKLLSGTWVSAGVVRVAAIAACSPLIQDCVVTGHDRDEIGLLIFPSLAACAARAGLPADASAAEIVMCAEVRDAIVTGLADYNRDNRASSARISRAMILETPPSIDANEITDKGYINQRAVLECRSGLVERLYAADPGDDVLSIGEGGS